MIVFFERILPNYNIALFRELNRAKGVILCVGNDTPVNTFISIAEPDFPHFKTNIYYPLTNNENLVIQDVFTPVLKLRPRIVILEFSLSIISNWLLFLLRPFLKYKIILRGHGWNRKKAFSPRSSLLDKIRVWLMNKSDAVIVYSRDAKKTIERYLKNTDKIFVGQNTLDTGKLIKLRDEYTEIGKENLKNQLGLSAKHNLIFVGRILKEKEPDRLIEVFKIISKDFDSIALQIVGDGPFLGVLKKRYNFPGIKFWNSITEDYQIGKLIFSSDLMVIPGYLGLSVVHSFCFDLPVLSQRQGKNGPFHSPEVEYIRQGKTGFLVDYGDNLLMAKTIKEYLLNNDQQLQMKRNIRELLNSECSFSNMVKGFLSAIDYVEKKK